jgi:hypothetical protein
MTGIPVIPHGLPMDRVDDLLDDPDEQAWLLHDW